MVMPMGIDDELRDSLVQVSFAVTATLSRVTVSGLIERAAERGLVHKKKDPADGRSVRVSLSADARRLTARVVAEIGELMTPLSDRLSAGEQKRLTALLEKMNND